MNPAPAAAGGNTKSAADSRLQLIGPDISIFYASNFPMSLLSKLARHFKDHSRRAGQEYFRAHRVSVRNGSSYNLEAEIKGIQTYWVSLDFSKGVLSAECNCPCAETDFCLHMYAVILMAERRGFLGEANGNPGLKINLGMPQDEEPLFPDSSADEVNDHESPNPDEPSR